MPPASTVVNNTDWLLVDDSNTQTLDLSPKTATTLNVSIPSGHSITGLAHLNNDTSTKIATVPAPTQQWHQHQHYNGATTMASALKNNCPAPTTKCNIKKSSGVSNNINNNDDNDDGLTTTTK